MSHPNLSWREQRKPLLAITPTGIIEFQSLWQAASYVSEHKHCLHATAKKEIRLALQTGHKRYNITWKWK